jgi:ABC-type Zn uptake system ZnuABC Zn-binding protein ZnuA
MDMVELCKEDHDHEGDSSHDSDHNHDEDEYDEHVWTSVANAIVIVDKLAGELEKLDGINKEILEQNRSAYNDKLSKLDAKFRELVSESAKKTIVVADRFPFMYMCKEYGIDYHAAFTGCATSVEPSTNMLLELANIVKSENTAWWYYNPDKMKFRSTLGLYIDKEYPSQKVFQRIEEAIDTTMVNGLSYYFFHINADSVFNTRRNNLPQNYAEIFKFATSLFDQTTQSLQPNTSQSEYDCYSEFRVCVVAHKVFEREGIST